MDQERMIVELLGRVAVLEEKVAVLQQQQASAEAKPQPKTIGSKKYRFLSDYLHHSGQDYVKLSFAQAEEILHNKLPQSAYQHRAFWANTESHSIALSWLNVGYQSVEVNLDGQYVVFEKQRCYK